jgi:hypothetical protein
MSIYYVYAYLREDNSPYYIGKGKDKRAWKKHGPGIFPPKDETKIKFIKSNLTESEAFSLEKRLIKWFGRKDKGTGVLRNMSDGGESGGSGRIPSEYEREYKRQLATGDKNPMKRPEIAQKVSKANKGKVPWNKGVKGAQVAWNKGMRKKV